MTVKPATEKDRHQAESELSQVLYEYGTLLEEEGPYCDNNTDAVYKLLGEVLFEKSLHSYVNASISALNGLAASEAGSILSQQMGSELYNTLCKMLERMVTFCLHVKNNEICLFKLNDLRWEFSDTSNIPPEVIRDLKIEYEHKLNILREDMKSGREWEYFKYIRDMNEV